MVETPLDLRYLRHTVAKGLHADDTPSLHVYDDPSRGGYCYGCRRGSSVYDLASAWYGIPARGEGFRQLQQRRHPLVDLAFRDP